MKTDLVLPDNITAVDAEDLVATILLTNGEKIEARNEERRRTQLASEARDKIRSRYAATARETYTKLWEQCRASTVGHDYINMDVKGKTVRECQTCGHAYGRGPSGEETTLAEGTANHMNEEKIRALQNRMIELDEEAGKLDWPMPNDFIGVPEDGKRQTAGLKGVWERIAQAPADAEVEGTGP